MEKKYRIIFHVDLNAFFASCEMAEDESLKNVPLGIGGSSDRGVLTTANYVARKYGVNSAMSVIEAKRICPGLVVLPVNFDLYHKYSTLFFELLSEYTDTIEKGSIDEGYMEMTDFCQEQHPLDIAKEIQERLVNMYDLPVSIGIAPNMFLPNMASNMKKPLGITVLRKRDVEKKLWPLDIKDMHGIGKKTVPNLHLLGIKTIGDLVRYEDHKKLSLALGNRTTEFVNKAKGFDNRTVDPYRYVDMKSIGNSSTFRSDIYEYNDAIIKFEALTKKVVDRLIKDESVAKTISIQVRYNDFSQINRSITLEYHTDSFFEIYEQIERLFDINQSEKPIRLLGVSVSNLIDKKDDFRQLNIFKISSENSKDYNVLKVIQSINENYDFPIIQKGLNKKG